VVADWRTAPIPERLRAMLTFLDKLTLDPGALTAADLAPLRREGIPDDAIEDAIQVCAIFNIFDRMADALGFEVPSPRASARASRFLLARGYA